MVKTMRKKILFISQSQDGSFVDIICKAADFCNADIVLLTGKKTGITAKNIEIVDMPSYRSETVKSKFLSWIKFYVSAKKWIKANKNSFDLVFLTSNPPIMCFFIKKIAQKFVYLVWDIYPNTIKSTFQSPIFKPVVAIWNSLNKGVYKKASQIITIGEIMKKTLERDIKDSQIIKVIPYHAFTELIKPIDKNENWFAEKYNLVDKTVFLYSGKMGISHNLNSIVDLAEQLKEDKSIAFLLIGAGPGYGVIEKRLAEYNPGNIILLPYQPLEVLPFSLASADVAFVSMNKGAEGLFLPSKVFDAMSAGLAILGITDGENDIKKMIEEYKVGINVSNDSAEQLKKAVLKFKEDKAFTAGCAKNARQTALAKFSEEVVINEYKQVFQKHLG
jgi:glycosyltransferase involved in cell wall biosynthesis